MFLTTTKKIWETAKWTYSKVQDDAQIYEIKAEIPSTKQGTSSVIEYYNVMKRLWFELNYYQNSKMKIVRMLLCFSSLLKESEYLYSQMDLKWNMIKNEVKYLGSDFGFLLVPIFGLLKQSIKVQSTQLRINLYFLLKSKRSFSFKEMNNQYSSLVFS